MNRNAGELVRYGINGVAATAVHYGVLSLNLNVLGFVSAGLANFVAALFGIGASFLGSRYFVFSRTESGILGQAMKFSGLYGALAVFHGLLLLVWTDFLGWDYRGGFLVATAIQVAASYLGNKFLVFKQ
ncbi:GtrA family protein [Hydrogenophaga sp. OTU3427]|uniref:GtrA family protein n=1 Tax=Hydrogenophaga sp. OTU3427 TaxID=3043856 RepID=UPI00313ABC82